MTRFARTTGAIGLLAVSVGGCTHAPNSATPAPSKPRTIGSTRTVSLCEPRQGESGGAARTVIAKVASSKTVQTVVGGEIIVDPPHGNSPREWSIQRVAPVSSLCRVGSVHSAIGAYRPTQAGLVTLQLTLHNRGTFQLQLIVSSV